MANVARVRVELPDMHPQASAYEVGAAVSRMIKKFKNICRDANISRDLRRYEAYESPGQTRRRKSREAEQARLKAMLRENFPHGKKKKKQKKQDRV